jgi:hypothetical protein
MTIEVICGLLALWAAAATIIAFFACCRSLEWQRRHRELLERPLSFWQHREVMRTLASRLSMPAFRAVPPLEPEGDVVRFRSPPPAA